jgi:6-phosphogluconolactonase
MMKSTMKLGFLIALAAMTCGTCSDNAPNDDLPPDDASPGPFLYVANALDSSIISYRISEDGSLTDKTSYPAESDAWAAAIDPSHTHLYVANFFTDTTTTFTINASSGDLHFVASLAGPSSAYGFSIAVAPSGQFAYVGSLGGTCGLSAYTIDATDGHLTEIAGSPYQAGESALFVAIHPGGGYLYCSYDNTGTIAAYKINADGSLSSINTAYAAGTQPQSARVDPSGKYLYVANFGGNIDAYGINQTDGTLTEITGSPVPTTSILTSLVIDPSGRFLYVTHASGGGSEVLAYAIAADGSLSSAGAAACGTSPQCVTFDASGQFVYTANSGSDNVSAFRRDQVTGALTELPGSPYAAGWKPMAVVATDTR